MVNCWKVANCCYFCFWMYEHTKAKTCLASPNFSDEEEYNKKKNREKPSVRLRLGIGLFRIQVAMSKFFALQSPHIYTHILTYMYTYIHNFNSIFVTLYIYNPLMFHIEEDIYVKSSDSVSFIWLWRRCFSYMQVV